MKSLTVWHGHSTRPSLPAGTARKASGHLSGRRLLHLANARPFGRLKAPLGLSLLRCAAQTRACLWQAKQAHHANNEKQEVPTGELPALLIVCGFLQGASGRAHPVFAFNPLIRDYLLHSSDTRPAHRSRSVRHTPAGHCR